MSKQEEIREGIKHELRKRKFTGEPLSLAEYAERIVNRLHSQGVVMIKPLTTDNNGLTRALSRFDDVGHNEDAHGKDTKLCPRCQLIKFMLAIDSEGMVAVEPLIKGEVESNV